MSRLALSKASLTHQQRQLKSFRQFLPSLDLKRKQLMTERARARTALAALRAQLHHFDDDISRELPMLANRRVRLDDLVRVQDVRIEDENVVGTHLPRLAAVQFEHAAYGRLTRPHWVDPLVVRLEQAIHLRLEVMVAEQRVQHLEQAVRVITQRVNLFEKVLIPRAQENIRRIRIFLSDSERAAVVRAKIAKAKLQKAIS